MKLAATLGILIGLGTLCGGFYLTIHDHGFVGFFAVGGGLMVTCLGCAGLID